jgi:hypothetical protein
LENLRGDLGDLDVDRRIILKWKQDVRVWNEFMSENRVQ